MPILLTNDDVKKLITPQIAVEVMRETYRSMAAGTGVTRTRSQTFGETRKEGTFVELRTSDGIVPSFGAVGMRVEDKADVVEAMRTALTTEGPVVLDVRVAQEENCYPMIPAGQAARDMVG